MPTDPTEWEVCPHCHSNKPAGSADLHCFAEGQAREHYPADAAQLPEELECSRMGCDCTSWSHSEKLGCAYRKQRLVSYRLGLAHGARNREGLQRMAKDVKAAMDVVAGTSTRSVFYAGRVAEVFRTAKCLADELEREDG